MKWDDKKKHPQCRLNRMFQLNCPFLTLTSNCTPPPITHISHIYSQNVYILCLYIPFCRISKCSQRISPVNGGALAKNPSRPRAIISRPRIFENAPIFPHSSENSFVAQLSQQITWSSLHRRGSIHFELMMRNDGEKKRKNQITFLLISKRFLHT